MDIVNQCLHIDRIAGVAVDGIRVVAGHAILDVGPRTAVELEPVVAGVTGIVVDDATRIGIRSRGSPGRRYKGENAVRGDRRLAADLDAEAMNLVFVENGPGRIGVQVVGERIGVRAVTVVDECAIRAALGVGLAVRNSPCVPGDMKRISLAGNPTRPWLRSFVRVRETVGAPPPEGTATLVTAMLIRSAELTGTPLPVEGPGCPGGPAGPGAPSAPGAPSLPSQPARKRPKRMRDAIRLERFKKLAILVTLACY
jgi:hypothetical protein